MKIFFSLALVVVIMVMVALYLFPERTVEPITGVYDEGLTIAYDKKESIVSG